MLCSRIPYIPSAKVVPDGAIVKLQRPLVCLNLRPLGFFIPHPLEGLNSDHGSLEQMRKKRLVEKFDLRPGSGVLAELTLEDNNPLRLEEEMIRLGETAAVAVLKHQPQIAVEFSL